MSARAVACAVRPSQGLWRPGRIRNLVVNPVYKGVLQYGRRRSRTSKRTEVIDAPVDGLVSPELWEAAQRQLEANRIMAKNTDHGTFYAQ
jgi:site-specific DNA recombinase